MTDTDPPDTHPEFEIPEPPTSPGGKEPPKNVEPKTELETILTNLLGPLVEEVSSIRAALEWLVGQQKTTNVQTAEILEQYDDRLSKIERKMGLQPLPAPKKH